MEAKMKDKNTGEIILYQPDSSIQLEVWVGVIKDTSDENYWELSKKLNRLTRNIDNRIEPVLLQAKDDRSGFLTTVLKFGIEL